MAGHSKWANIKHKKAREDAKKGKVFTKIGKKLRSAARRGGGDPDTNAELRLYIQKAKDANMPKDKIEYAILKATGQLEGISYEDFIYEGYGPGGVAIMVEGSTDNKNRTVGNIRYLFSKHGGNLGENGCVGWMFHEKGVLSLEADGVDDLDTLLMVALEYGLEDYEVDDGVLTLTCAPEAYVSLREGLAGEGYEFMDDELTRVAENEITPELADVKKNMKLLELLEDDDDIDNVYHNLNLTDEVAAALD